MFMAAATFRGGIKPYHGFMSDENEAHPSRPEELNAIALQSAERPVVSSLSDDEILGYDEAGVPVS
jgi:hypothetical protein